MANKSTEKYDQQSEDELVDRVSRRVAGTITTAVSEAVAGLRDDVAGVERKTSTGTKYKVTGPGYSEQFTAKKPALDSYDKLIKRLMKNEQAATVKLLVQESNSTKWTVEQELKVNEDHY